MRRWIMLTGLLAAVGSQAANYDWNNASSDGTMEGVNWFNINTPLVNEAITTSSHQINFRGHTTGDVVATFNDSVPGFTSGGSGNIYYTRAAQTSDVFIRNVAGSAKVLRILHRTNFTGGQVLGIIEDGGGNFTIGGSGSDPITLVLGTGAGTKYGRITNLATNDSKLTIGDNVNFQVGGGTGSELRFEGAGDIDFFGSLIGGQTGTATRNITKQDAGTLLLAGDNTTNDSVSIGTITHNGGTIAVGHNNALGSGTVTLSNGARLTADASDRTIANKVTNVNGAILGQAGAGRLTLSGDWVTSDARSLTVEGEVEVSGTLADSGTGSDARDLNGGGTLIISGDQSHLDSNRFYLTHGTVRAAHDNAVGGTGQLSVDVRNSGTYSGQSTLELDNNVTIDVLARINGRDLSGTHWTQLRNVGGSNTLSSVELTDGGNDYGIESDAGKLIVGAISGETGDRDLYVSGAGDVEIPDWNTRRDIVKDGAGTLTISGASTHTGKTTLSAGTTHLTHHNALQNSTVVLDGGALSYATGGVGVYLGGLSGDASQTLNITGGNLRAGQNNEDTEFAGTLTGGSALAKMGTGILTLSGTNQLTAPTMFIADGTVKATQLSALGTQTIDVQSVGSTFEMAFSGENTVDNQIISFGDTGTVVHSGTGTTTLTANNSYGGTTTVVAGRLLINGSHSGAGLITVASGAAIGGGGSVAGGLTLDAGAKFIFDPLTSLTLGAADNVTMDSTFGVASLVNADGSAIDWGLVSNARYTLLDGTTTDFSHITNFGAGDAFDIGGGRSAYFDNGSLQLVVIPEPATLGLMGVIFGGILFWRRLLA